MRLFYFIFLLINFYSTAGFSSSLSYINGLYLNKNCDYFSAELKKNWAIIPEDQKDTFLTKLADCSIERGQFEFAESLFRNLEKKNYNSTLLNQAKAKLDVSRNDFRKITDDYEEKRPTKATFQYYIYVSQSYYEQENYDESLKVLNFISPQKLTSYQKNIIRYWKAKNYFLKDDYEKSKYFIDLILDSDESNWITDAAKALKSSVNARHKLFRAIIYFTTNYEDNVYKNSVHDTISMSENSNNYIKDIVYRFNPTFDFYLVKNQKIKSGFNLDVSMAWASETIDNQAESFSLKYKKSNKVNDTSTLSWELGFTKSQTKFKDVTNDGFLRLGLFHLIAPDLFSTVTYRYSKNTIVPNKSGHAIFLSLFSILESQMIYGTISRSQNYDENATYSFDGISAPLIDTGVAFGNYSTTSFDLAHSLDFNDFNSFRTQLSYVLIGFQEENLPAGSEVFTNDLSKRSDSILSLTLAYTHRYNDETNIELFATTTKGTTKGFQGYSYSTFAHKNYTANQIGVNLDWTYE